MDKPARSSSNGCGSREKRCRVENKIKINKKNNEKNNDIDKANSGYPLGKKREK